MAQKVFGWLFTIIGVFIILLCLFGAANQIFDIIISFDNLIILISLLILSIILLRLGFLLRNNRFAAFKNNFNNSISKVKKKLVLASILLILGIIITLFSQTDLFFNREAVKENKYQGKDPFGYSSAFGKEESITRIVKHPNRPLMLPFIFAGYILIFSGGFLLYRSAKKISE